MRAAKGRVLIVEDDPLIASLVAMIMESELACESVTAHSVAKAADLMDTPTSLGVLDVEVGDGLTFPLALQLLARGIPCVFVSGSDPARVPPALVRTPFLRKPVSSRDLTAAARQLLANEPDAIAADRARRTPLLIAEGFPDLAPIEPRSDRNARAPDSCPYAISHTSPSARQSKLIVPCSWLPIMAFISCVPKPSRVGGATGGPPVSVHRRTT